MHRKPTLFERTKSLTELASTRKTSADFDADSDEKLELLIREISKLKEKYLPSLKSIEQDPRLALQIRFLNIFYVDPLIEIIKKSSGSPIEERIESFNRCISLIGTQFKLSVEKEEMQHKLHRNSEEIFGLLEKREQLDFSLDDYKKIEDFMLQSAPSSDTKTSNDDKRATSALETIRSQTTAGDHVLKKLAEHSDLTTEYTEKRKEYVKGLETLRSEFTKQTPESHVQKRLR